ncbi:hypothetical protein L7F22_033435 [Adiantum nelumboides]|nr:hypothetical protein [Adiantum nelumboides]
MMESNVFSSFSFKARTQTHARSVESVVGCVEIEATQCAEKDIEDLKKCSSPPPNWPEVIQLIRSMRAGQDAPVDQMGTHQLADGTADKKTQQFQLLVAAVISSQTRDSVTAAAMTRLHALPGGLTVGNLSKQELTIFQLAEILKPVGFYRQKAKHLKAIAEKLSGCPFNGQVPSTLDELLKLPGVGPKIALLVLWVAFGRCNRGQLQCFQEGGMSQTGDVSVRDTHTHTHSPIGVDVAVRPSRNLRSYTDVLTWHRTEPDDVAVFTLADF